ncbi:MAG: alanine/glycine:cation symporter family protein [Parahaliea sp.]
MLSALSNFLWDYVLALLLVSIGLLFTIASRGVQFRFFGRMFTVLCGGLRHEKGRISSFQALVVSVAGRVGGGNIGGVAVAITLGGPGAVFWMWLIGLMGMATSFFECSLAQLYKRREPDGTYRGGPAYYLQNGARQRWLAIVYSILLLITFGFGFNALQSYMVATSIEASFGLSPWVTGVCMAVFMGLIIFGGIQRIAAVAEVIVPLMALGYLLAALSVLIINLSEIPAMLVLIVKSAFGLEQAIGGGLGVALMEGIKRGLFSNEAGLGSAPNVAAVAYVPHPVNQGIVQAFSVFIDTIIMCTCTALIILLSDIYQSGLENIAGVALTQNALASHVGEWGAMYVSMALVLFAFSSIMYNYFLGENSLGFLCHNRPVLLYGFRIIVLALLLWGSLQDLKTVFGFADLTMGLLGLVNLVGLLWMFKIAMRLLNDYDNQLKVTATPRLKPEDYCDLDIDPGAWRS